MNALTRRNWRRAAAIIATFVVGIFVAVSAGSPAFATTTKAPKFTVACDCKSVAGDNGRFLLDVKNPNASGRWGQAGLDRKAYGKPFYIPAGKTVRRVLSPISNGAHEVNVALSLTATSFRVWAATRVEVLSECKGVGWFKTYLWGAEAFYKNTTTAAAMPQLYIKVGTSDEEAYYDNQPLVRPGQTIKVSLNAPPSGDPFTARWKVGDKFVSPLYVWGS